MKKENKKKKNINKDTVKYNKKNGYSYKEFPLKYKIILITILTIIGIGLFLFYIIKTDALGSLWYDLKQSASVLGIIGGLFVIFFILGLCNYGDYNYSEYKDYKFNGVTYDEITTKVYKQKSAKEKIKDENNQKALDHTFAILVYIILGIFLLCVLLSLLEFLLPIIIVIIILIAIYFFIKWLIIKFFI